MTLKPVWIYLENGVFLEAKSFGFEGTKTGEIVFNTSMSGYQEILSDPSYAGQFIVFTMPEIGIVGTNDNDMESRTIHASGMFVRSLNLTPSNFRSQASLSDFLKQHQSMGICDIDTRYLTKMIRDGGPQMMIASTEVSDVESLKEMLRKSPRIEEVNYIEKVSTPESYRHTHGAWNAETQSYNASPKRLGKKILAVDLGIKRNILNELCEVGLDVEVIPHNFNGDEVIARYKKGEIHGLFLSNGPGDPLILKSEAQEVKKLIDAKVPIFAICLGHQLLSIAHGYPTYKLKFGQHGGNHPVKNMTNHVVEITTQNHNYNVPDSICKIAKITHVNLFDNTIEGLEYNDSPIFSVQHHPEASSGPQESRYIFQEFANRL
ncbi:glutamine-hydrolyzing carbamoyl-phosphate synthase small subunit [Sulfurospirillum sp. hDNRA2]|uniref:glutamine-hydrolyzing carbamoyl-phosphate synthase small subunit n=1 Tax=Sulfurospirillum sp. hDNRA2 TaxID=3237298 RepID=UPI0020B815B7|nr:glutamine-hydrolyzing carbamoyl-phosphate synthase small subunit [Sulfurospirillum sp. DNRA8]MCP3652634.1 glutamine-hydrolyzing carbamoyl-phosphate synthase small subunit [Sulfurospirillum sp. DNRA8]MCR1811485.1 glutamine-hydrolyzing carbamoyl-phosphate synthase small subunit [Sulfurospirillum sp. DNRA8]